MAQFTALFDIASLTFFFFLKSEESKDIKPSLLVDNHSLLVFSKNLSSVIYFRIVVPLLALIGIIYSNPSSFRHTDISIDSPRVSSITYG